MTLDEWLQATVVVMQAAHKIVPAWIWGESELSRTDLLAIAMIWLELTHRDAEAWLKLFEVEAALNGWPLRFPIPGVERIVIEAVLQEHSEAGSVLRSLAELDHGHLLHSLQNGNS